MKELSIEHKEFILMVLRNDLEALENMEEPMPATEQCKEVTKDMIKRFEAENMEVDGFDNGYFGTILYNYYPKSIEESQKLIDVYIELSDLFPTISNEGDEN